ncbi:uncharacterized protein LOC127375145 isoform X2 [Dicentrarchus labrax]|uniref:uncharacterized protein LOC127375145 isoform X2 n=1 Tax=Dicentrarchus labrax TaxID=13489 RepID=UPI0021F60AD3|nr:uncharacterized protein LOC127375145 isoform X2 [Dicentrarchus labrax]
MMTPWVFSGAALFALLIVDICCVPIKKGINPGVSYGGSSMNAAPNYGSYQEAPSGQFSPGVMPNNADTGVSTPSYQPVPQWEPSISQPAVQRQPSASVGSNSALIGYRSTQPGPVFQPRPKDIDWAVAPPSPFSDQEMSAGPGGVGSSAPEDWSPALPPPGPMYQPGELSQYKVNLEDGYSEMETEEDGYSPYSPRAQEAVGQGFTSEPRPEARIWLPYPYHDYMFLTGQYPPGTVTHSSQSYEQGSDYWGNARYWRHYPYSPATEQQDVTFTPQRFEAPVQPVKHPVMAYGKTGP